MTDDQDRSGGEAWDENEEPIGEIYIFELCLGLVANSLIVADLVSVVLSVWPRFCSR